MNRAGSVVAPMALLSSLVAIAPQAAAQSPASAPAAVPATSTPRTSPYRIVPHTEDWSFLADKSRSHSFLDPIKYIPLGTDPSWYLSLGGEIRAVYEFYDNNAFGAGPQDDDGFLLQRYMFHADLHLSRHFRAYLDLKSNLADGREGGPRPPDEDRFDLHQAFVDLSAYPSDDTSITFRPGRQELLYGSARLISHRNGPNVRQSFDGFKLITRTAGWQIDGFFVRPVETDTGILDDDTIDQRSLWAAYATRPLASLGRRGGIDFYYIGARNEEARFVQGAGRETRHTLGSRLFGAVGNFDFNWELMGQFGEFAGDQIRAWSLGTDNGYTLANAPFSPRFGLKANVISGDSDPRDGSLGTFNALYPRGGYFGEIGLIGPANLLNLHPQVDFNLRRDLTLTFDTVFFWRYSLDDGVYGPSGNLVRGPSASDARYIGTQPSVILTYRPTDQLQFIATYSVFVPGKFIEQTGPDETIHFVRLEAQFKF